MTEAINNQDACRKLDDAELEKVTGAGKLRPSKTYPQFFLDLVSQLEPRFGDDVLLHAEHNDITGAYVRLYRYINSSRNIKNYREEQKRLKEYFFETFECELNV